MILLSHRPLPSLVSTHSRVCHAGKAPLGAPLRPPPSHPVPQLSFSEVPRPPALSARLPPSSLHPVTHVPDLTGVGLKFLSGRDPVPRPGPALASFRPSDVEPAASEDVRRWAGPTSAPADRSARPPGRRTACSASLVCPPSWPPCPAPLVSLCRGLLHVRDESLIFLSTWRSHNLWSFLPRRLAVGPSGRPGPAGLEQPPPRPSDPQ